MAKVEVRPLAEKQGFNISSLARRADISYPTMHALWHGHVVRVDLVTLEAVARVLGVRTGDLIVDEPVDSQSGTEEGKSKTPALAAA